MPKTNRVTIKRENAKIFYRPTPEQDFEPVDMERLGSLDCPINVRLHFHSSCGPQEKIVHFRKHDDTIVAVFRMQSWDGLTWESVERLPDDYPVE